MQRDDFQDLMREEFEKLLETNKRKGHDYAGDDDALANFKRNAAALGLRPEQVWAVYAGKHWDAIMTYVREGGVQSEPIEGRIHDLILYGLLLLGMVKEREQQPTQVLRGAGDTVRASIGSEPPPPPSLQPRASRPLSARRTNG